MFVQLLLADEAWSRFKELPLPAARIEGGKSWATFGDYAARQSSLLARIQDDEYAVDRQILFGLYFSMTSSAPSIEPPDSDDVFVDCDFNCWFHFVLSDGRAVALPSEDVAANGIWGIEESFAMLGEPEGSAQDGSTAQYMGWIVTTSPSIDPGCDPGQPLHTLL